jgi:glycosyltransferase involved in cell wall biosynthesis
MGKNRINIAFVSSYLPRPCGIATFTDDLIQSIRQINKNVKMEVIAVTDPKKEYNYPSIVKDFIRPDKPQSFIEAARRLNESKIDLVNIQHEFGLFGEVGKDDGENLILFLQRLKRSVPVVLTFHMVYPNPDKHMKEVVRKLCYFSQKVMVLVGSAWKTLVEDYGIDSKKIIVIPHGSPKVERRGSGYFKELLKIPKDHFVLMTFGLIRPKKGIEHILHAMPKILKSHPKTLYVVLGTPHPNRPLSYYFGLIKLAKKLKIEKNVLFINKFLAKNQVIKYLQASNVFIATYLVLEQVSSGAVLDAMACGKAVIATPFIFAKEALGEGRGILVPKSSSAAIAEAVLELIKNNEKRHAIERAAYYYAKERVWDKVAEQYLKLFYQLIREAS